MNKHGPRSYTSIDVEELDALRGRVGMLERGLRGIKTLANDALFKDDVLDAVKVNFMVDEILTPKVGKVVDEREEHIERHKQLHEAFDELLADFLSHTNALPTKTPIIELMEWSSGQMVAPDAYPCLTSEEGGEPDV